MTAWAVADALAWHDAVLCVEIEGIGRRINGLVGGATSDPYRLVQRRVAGDSAGTLLTDRIVECLSEIPDSIAERLDLRQSTTDLGSMSISILHSAVPSTAVAAQGWTSLLDCFSVHAAGDAWTLTQRAYAADDHFHVTSSAGMTAGYFYWIGSETVRCDAVSSGVLIQVTRGLLGSLAAAHPAAASGDGTLYDRPRYLRGRRVTVTLTYRDPAIDATAAGVTVVPVAGESVLWRGLIDDASMREPGVIVLSCRDMLARLNRSVGRQLFEAQIVGGLEVLKGKDPQDVLPLDLKLEVNADATQKIPLYPPSLDAVTGRYFWPIYARVGDQVCECWIWGNNACTSVTGARILATACCGTADGSFPDGQSTSPVTLREVLATPPPAGLRPRGDPALLDRPWRWRGIRSSGRPGAGAHDEHRHRAGQRGLGYGPRRVGLRDPDR